MTQEPPSYESIFPEYKRNAPLPLTPPPVVVVVEADEVAPLPPVEPSKPGLFDFKNKLYRKWLLFGLFCSCLASFRLSWRYKMNCAKVMFGVPVTLVGVAIFTFCTAPQVTFNAEHSEKNQTAILLDEKNSAHSQTINFMFWAFFIYCGLVVQVRRKFVDLARLTESMPKTCCVMTWCQPCAHGQMGV